MDMGRWIPAFAGMTIFKGKFDFKILKGGRRRGVSVRR
jgi:hypothetical protein